jgi:2'-5' RNA ligase
MPQTVEDSLEDLCEGIPHARWALENEFHLTLSFLGEVPQHRVLEVIDIGHSLRSPIFELALKSVGVFPHRGAPRVLWAGVDKERHLESLQRTLQAELRRANFALEKRKFRPHITLARVDRCPQAAISEWLAQHLSYESPPFRVARFGLLSSVLTSSGSRHSVEKLFPFPPRSSRTPGV